MTEATTERRWTCLGCGEPWPVVPGGAGYPGMTDQCACGREQWTYQAFNDRSKAENADRLEAMAAESHAREQRERAEGWADVELDECQSTRDELADLLNAAESARSQAVAECERLAPLLAESRAECERLRVIVDAAIVVHEATESWPTQVVERARMDGQVKLRALVAAEVERRG